MLISMIVSTASVDEKNEKLVIVTSLLIYSLSIGNGNFRNTDSVARVQKIYKRCEKKRDVII